MKPATDLIVALLLTDGPLPALSASPPPDPLIAAASALATGEPKRALRLLDGAQGPRAEALRIAAHTLDLNWSPGGSGAVMSQEEMERAGVAPPRPSDPDAALVTLVAARFIPFMQSARSIADNSRTGGAEWAADNVISELHRLGDELDATGIRHVRCAHRLAVADLTRRAGRSAEAASALDACRRAADGDPLVTAQLNVLQGDFILTPESHPELLGLRLDPLAAPGTTPASLDVAEAHYATADILYGRTSAPRGEAAVALRRAHLARLSGERTARVRHLDRARGLASGALAQVVAAHRMLDDIEEGDDVPWHALADIAAWGRGDGSTSFVRGLVRLFVARAAAWREAGLTLAALRCLRSARHLVGSITAPPESELTDRAYLDLVDRLNFRSASAVLLCADTARATQALRAPGADTGTWLRAADLAMSLDGAVEALADPDLKAVSAARLGELAAEAGRLADPWPPAAAAADAVRESLRRSPALLLRHRARKAQQAGFRDEAQALLQEALDRSYDDALLRVVLLYELERRDEAHSLAMALYRSGGLHPDHAVSLFLRLGDPRTAREAQEQLARTGPMGSPERPWEGQARRAELAEALGDHAMAAALGDEAVSRFEEWSDRLVRDVLRTSMTDNMDVASMYHTAVRAHLGLSAAALDPKVADAELAAAFELSDRCRGIGAEVLRSLDDLPAGPPLDAARRWLRAGSAWAAVYEGLVESVTGDPARTPSSTELRRKVLAAEDDLERAEAQVTRLAPGLIRGSRGVGARAAQLESIRGSLAHDELLVMYETSDEDLLTWVVDHDGVRHIPQHVHHRDLACDIRRFHTVCATGRRDPMAAAALSGRLLRPVREALGGCRRLFVVPHRALALVPFHALPVAGVPLGERCAVSQLPSAALVTRPRSGMAPPAGESVLLVGDPVYAADRELARLPGTATEAAAISRLLGASPLLGAAATREAVVGAAPGCAVLHLATHGVLYEQGPNRSYVALAGHDRLTVGDMTGLQLAAELVVLSACHTGRGTATAGGDVIGLVRAAVAAGARNVVVSLWPVDDEAGAVLMTYLYEELASGNSRSVAQALASAQRRVRPLNASGRREAYDRLREPAGTATAATCARDGRVPSAVAEDSSDLPYFWAPFIHVGV
ncbi:CHAT domain-containing protein [Streptomyces sp. NPDC056486]|uniref:CHAT domain-containing protein n=1 Tax=Streptomyces sp. NPDC056486 TaxID=3345835 RepID=UPI0036BC7E0B